MVGHSLIVRLLLYYSLLTSHTVCKHRSGEDLRKGELKKNQEMVYWEAIITFKRLLFRCKGTHKLAHTIYMQMYLVFLIHITII